MDLENVIEEATEQMHERVAAWWLERGDLFEPHLAAWMTEGLVVADGSTIPADEVLTLVALLALGRAAGAGEDGFVVAMDDLAETVGKLRQIAKPELLQELPEDALRQWAHALAILHLYAGQG